MANYSVSRLPFFCHLGICIPICVKLLQAMSGVISRNLKKTTSLPQTLFLVSTNAAYIQTHKHTHTHTHTQRHTHMSIAIGEMQCVAFRLKIRYLALCNMCMISNAIERKRVQVELIKYLQQNSDRLSVMVSCGQM